MKGALGAALALVLVGAAAVAVLAYNQARLAAEEAAVARAAEVRARELQHRQQTSERDPGEELRLLQERFDALQTEHEEALARLRELEGAGAVRPEPLPYADFQQALAAGDGQAALHFLRAAVARGAYDEAIAMWKALLEAEDPPGTGLSELELIQAMALQPDLMELLLVDTELDRDVRELAANALGQLDEETQARMMDSIFADHGLEDEIGRTRIALIDAMNGFDDPESQRHLSQLNALIESQNEPGLDHYAAIVIASHDGPSADAAFELLVQSESAWVQKKLPVLAALHDPHVDHGAFIISDTVDGHLVPGDAVVECNGQRIEGWKDLRRLVEATDKGTLLPFVVVDVNGEYQTRYVPGRADLRCLGRDL